MRRKLMQVMMERDRQFRLIKTALRGTCHAIRPKYTRRFLSEFEYRFIRRFDLPVINPILANVALRTPPMPQRLLELNLARVVLRGRKLAGSGELVVPGARCESGPCVPGRTDGAQPRRRGIFRAWRRSRLNPAVSRFTDVPPLVCADSRKHRWTKNGHPDINQIDFAFAPVSARESKAMPCPEARPIP